MTINPIFEQRLMGNSGATMVYSPDIPVMDFKAHPKGLKLRFVNMDPAATNVIHGSGAIPHQSSSMPLQPSPDGVQPGTAYEVTILPSVFGSGTFYSHSYGGKRHTVNFGK
jgi:hypothetical protein